MKTLIIVAAIACVAYVQITQAQRQPTSQDNLLCHRRPPLQSVLDVICDERQSIGLRIRCAIRCRLCYTGEELDNETSCLVRRRCVCLGRSGSTTEDGGSEASTDRSEEPSTPGGDASEQPPTTDRKEEATTGGDEPVTERL